MSDVQKPSRPPVRLETHAAVIAYVLGATLGGTMFGLAFAVWPKNTYEQILGGVILAAVVGLWVWVVRYLQRPIGTPPRGRRR